MLSNECQDGVAMRRSISVLLIIALLMSLTGCNIDTNQIGEDIKNEASVLVSGIIDEAADHIEEEIDQAIEEGKKKASNWWGDLIGCNHEPKSYLQKKNTVVCACRANQFSNLDYDTFVSCVSWHNTIFKNKDQYCAEAYLKYRGVNAAFFDLMDQMDLGSDYQETLNKLGEVHDVLKKLNIGKTVWINFVGNADAIEEVTKFDKVLDTSLTIVDSVIHLHKMLDAKEEPYEACDQFIETVKGPVGLLNGATGIYLSVGLSSLKTVLDAYKIGSQAHLKNLEYTAALSMDPADGPLITKWISIKETEIYWKQALTYEHIMGTKKIEGLALPSLPEIVAEYENFSDSGKAFSGEYILFCLDYVFEDIFGITYQEYIAYLNE